MKNYLLLLGLAATFTFTSCDKDDDAQPSKSEMLSAKTWKLTARNQVTTDSAGTTIGTNTTVDACEQDDTFKFNADKSYVADEGATKCDPNAAQTQTGTWALTDNDTKLTVTVGNFALPAEVIELTSSKLVVKSTLEFFGDKIVATNTFTAQ